MVKKQIAETLKRRHRERRQPYLMLIGELQKHLSSSMTDNLQAAGYRFISFTGSSAPTGRDLSALSGRFFLFVVNPPHQWPKLPRRFGVMDQGSQDALIRLPPLSAGERAFHQPDSLSEMQPGQAERISKAGTAQ